MAPYTATFRPLSLFFILGWIVHLLGIALFSRLLARAGGEQLAILAFTLIILATTLAILYSAFRMSVELWAAQEAARTGSLPAFYAPLKEWVSNSFRVASRVHFVAVAGVGWGILRTALLAPWMGQVTIGWSLLWLLVGLGGGVPPAMPLLMPAVIGVALLVKAPAGGGL